MRILQKDNPLLRQKAEEVPLLSIGSAKVRRAVKKMKVALEAEYDGVAIAAPQIGIPLRIFVVSHRTFAYIKNLESKDGPASDRAKHAKIESKGERKTDQVFINPKLIRLSKKRSLQTEGCLSVRHWYGEIMRATKAAVSAYDENGLKFERGGSGLMAQIFQHEIDHLNGVLFTDTAKGLHEVNPQINPHKNDEHNEPA